MARFITRTDGVYVSLSLRGETVARRPDSRTTRAPSSCQRDPAFAEKVADVVGLYLDPVGFQNPGYCR